MAPLVTMETKLCEYQLNFPLCISTENCQVWKVCRPDKHIAWQLHCLQYVLNVLAFFKTNYSKRDQVRNVILVLKVRSKVKKFINL